MKILKILIGLSFFLSTCSIVQAGSPEDSFLSDTIIIHYKESTKLVVLNGNKRVKITRALRNQLAALSRSTGTKLKHLLISGTGSQVVTLPKKITQSRLKVIAAKIARDPKVEYAHISRVMQAALVPNDTRYGEQWALHNYPGVSIQLEAAIQQSAMKWPVVGVIDTGYRPHVDLAPKVVAEYDFITSPSRAQDGDGRDSSAIDVDTHSGWYACQGSPEPRINSWHGTHVAGSIAAVTHNNRGVAGVAPNARLVFARVLGKCGGMTYDINDAIIWIAGGAVPNVPNNPRPVDVINMSLGGEGACDADTQRAINTATNLGAVVIVAAGNDGLNVRNYSPASCKNVVAVAATNHNGNRASFSNFGRKVDLAAPGTNILSTHNTGINEIGFDSYGIMSGTSMSAPHVAGVAALIKSFALNASANDVKKILKKSAAPFVGNCNRCGKGVLDAKAAVDLARGLELVSGKTKYLYFGSLDSRTFYKFTVPEGASYYYLTAQRLNGGTGSVEIMTNKGTVPGDGRNSCIGESPPWSTISTTCYIENPPSGTYYVRIKGVTDYSRFRLYFTAN